MIRRLQIRNFRNHVDTDFPLEPLTVFIGPVASGKSNVFKALRLLQSTLHRRPEELFPPGLGEFRWVRSRWAKTTEAIAFTVEIEEIEGFPEQRARYELELAEGPSGIFVAHERLERYGGPLGEKPGQLVFDRGIRGGRLGEFGHFDPHDPTVLCTVRRRREQEGEDNEETIRFARAVAHFLSLYGYYHLEVSQLRRTSEQEQSSRLGYQGESLPAFLSTLRNTPEYAVHFERILEEMRQLLPDLEDILITLTRNDQLGVSFQFSGQNGFIAAPDTSDGTLLTLGLLCILNQPNPPNLLSLEEPENGISPGRLKWLFERLVALAYSRGNGRPVQTLISTHSPYILDFFRDQPGAVRVVETEEGHARVRSLVDILSEMPEDERSREVPLGHQWYMGLFGKV